MCHPVDGKISFFVIRGEQSLSQLSRDILMDERSAICGFVKKSSRVDIIANQKHFETFHHTL
jgi:DNA polymerase II small subunit/DNA polymerase delta subunit B